MVMATAIPDWVTNTRLRGWVTEMVALCRPDLVRWCDGSQAEYDALCDELVQSGTFIRLNPEHHPGSFLARSDPGDVARVEDREMLADTMLSETSTLGVRFHAAERRVQARTMVEVETPYGKVRVKVAGNGGFAPEYEDCRTLAMEKNVPLPTIFAAVSQSYLNQK